MAGEGPKERGARECHGHAHVGAVSDEYNIWHLMKSRCENAANKAYARYGGREIRVCPRWRDSFSAFLADMGRRPSRRHSLDRIDNDGNYEPGNCRWATRVEQMSNTNSNVYLEHGGQRRTLAEWARHVGISKSVLTKRQNLGWSAAEILGPARVTRLAGEAAPRARLTNANVLELRELASQGVPSAVLAARFGIKRDYARQIARGLAWSHIGGPLLRSLGHEKEGETMSFRKVPDQELKPNEKPPCLSDQHNPPTMIVLPPGTYEWTCPSCGNVIRLHQPMVTC